MLQSSVRSSPLVSKLIDLATAHLPLWAIGIALTAIFVGASEVGRLVARRRDLRQDGRSQASSSQAYVVTAIFALLAFMLATTFSMALSRFDTRRLALANEVDAIGTAYLRASLLDPPNAVKIRALLRQYAHCRTSSKDWSEAQVEMRIRVCQGIGHELWLETRAAVQPVRTTALASYTVSAINDVLNAATRREIAGRAVIPARVVSLLLICTIAAAAALGSTEARASKRLQASTALLLTLYAICFVLILDIDRARTGTVAVSQLPMAALSAELDADSP